MTAHRFGPFRYDSAQRLLYRNSELIPLAPKAADTLHALLEHRGDVVSKANLMKAVWPDCVVEEIGLARNISILRKTLGDESEIYIETIPKRGYRFAAEIAATPDPKPRLVRGWMFSIACAAALAFLIYWQFYRPSRYLPDGRGAATLAVVPFECLSSDLVRDRFSPGFTERVAAEVSKIQAAQTISPGTIERYERLHVPTPFMTRILGVDVIVEGTAQRFGDKVRISVRLTDVHSGRLIWAEGYDANSQDLGQAESRIAYTIASQIGTHLARH
jgi:DNA-binding winged helix-turn-helix (wHTH) protein/TolB-like protein